MSNISIIAVAIVIVFGGLYYAFDYRNGGSESANINDGLGNSNNQVNEEETMDQQPAGEVGIEIIREGTGEGAKNGDMLTVHYTGTFMDGSTFDSSVGREPFSLQLGQGGVIPGWEMGLQGMKAGEKRKLTIPSDLAYGSTGYGPIPPNATLIFEVELVKIN